MARRILGVFRVVRHGCGAARHVLLTNQARSADNGVYEDVEGRGYVRVTPGAPASVAKAGIVMAREDDEVRRNER